MIVQAHADVCLRQAKRGANLLSNILEVQMEVSHDENSKIRNRSFSEKLNHYNSLNDGEYHVTSFYLPQLYS